MFVSRTLAEGRLTICKSCPHSVMNLGVRTCGPIGRPTPVEGGSLCGCVMEIKTKLRTSKCPIGKWRAEVSDADVEKAQAFLATNPSRIKHSDVRELYRLHAEITGKKHPVAACSSCLADVMQEMRVALKEGIR